MKNLILLLSLVVLSACQTNPPVATDPCVVTRAAFDIGSGDTKLKVAKVNICQAKIETVLLDSKRDVGYKDDFAKSKDQTLSVMILAVGTKALADLKAEAQKFDPSQYSGVATAAFRDAKNGEKFVETVSKDLDIPIRVISQREEGILGFNSVRARVSEMKPESSVIWDIGGGSQQLVMQKADHSLQVYEGSLASVSFKNDFILKVQKKKGETPNPMTATQAGKGILHAKAIADKTVPPEMKAALATGAQVYGIGGVHNFSIQSQVKKGSAYSIQDLSAVIQSRLGKTDKQLGAGPYVNTDSSNPLLVKGFMEALGIKNVIIVKANLTEGLLLSPEFWSKE